MEKEFIYKGEKKEKKSFLSIRYDFYNQNNQISNDCDIIIYIPFQ